MKRQTAFVVAGSVGLGLGGLVLALAINISGERARARSSYDAALYDQRRAATAEEPARPSAPPPPSPQTVCVGGVDTFAAAIARSLDRPLAEGGKLDVAALRWLSSQAVRGQRRAERAHAGPALPQRLGRRRDELTGDWKPVAPEARDCGGKDAYAVVAVDARKTR